MTARIAAPFLLAAACLAGCVSTTNVMQTGANSFAVSATADGMRPATHAREQAFETANQKCRSLGKTIKVLSDQSERTRMNIDTTYTLNFTCE